MLQPVLTALAAGGEHPLIDIDGSIFIQFGLFLLLALVATNWLFKPYLKMREERAEGIEGARAEAVQLSAEAEGRLAEYESQLARARARALAEQSKTRAETAAQERELTDKARSAATQAVDEAKATVARESAAARAELMPRADALAQDIVTKLLGRKAA